MTIAIQITNKESEGDVTKELLVYGIDKRAASNVQPDLKRSLKGGESMEITVHSNQHIRLEERFVDKTL